MVMVDMMLVRWMDVYVAWLEDEMRSEGARWRWIWSDEGRERRLSQALLLFNSGNVPGTGLQVLTSMDPICTGYGKCGSAVQCIRLCSRTSSSSS
jgi:hypothetical protein